MLSPVSLFFGFMITSRPLVLATRHFCLSPVPFSFSNRGFFTLAGLARVWVFLQSGVFPAENFAIPFFLPGLHVVLLPLRTYFFCCVFFSIALFLSLLELEGDLFFFLEGSAFFSIVFLALSMALLFFGNDSPFAPPGASSLEKSFVLPAWDLNAISRQLFSPPRSSC